MGMINRSAMRSCFLLGKWNQGCAALGRKLNAHDVRLLREWWAEPHGLSCAEFGRLAAAQWNKAGFSISSATVEQVVKYESWRWVE